MNWLRGPPRTLSKWMRPVSDTIAGTDAGEERHRCHPEERKRRKACTRARLTSRGRKVHVTRMRSRDARRTGEQQRPAWPARLAAYALAAAFVLVAFAGTALLKQRWPLAPSFMFFVPAIALTAWRTGRGATVLATTLSLLLIDWFFLPPLRSLAIVGSTSVLDIIAFLVLTATIIVATEALRRAHQVSERRARELQAVSTRASKLLSVTTALSEATTAAEVTRVFLDQGLAVLEAPRGALVRSDGTRHEVLQLFPEVKKTKDKDDKTPGIEATTTAGVKKLTRKP